MQRIILIIMIVLLGCPFRLLAQTNWTHFNGSPGNDGSAGIHRTPSGDVLSASWFSSLITVGSQSLNTAGGADILIVRTNAAGLYQWAVRFGGSGDDKPLAITGDAAGNAYITGTFNGSIQFGAITLVSAGLQDVFVAKLDPGGTVIWAVSGGGPLNDQGTAIAVSAIGNVSVTGAFSSSAQFGANTLNSVPDPQTGFPSQDIFVATYSAAGVLQWIKQGSGPYADRGTGIAVGNSGEVYVCGQFSDTLTFDQVHPGTAQNAVFLVRFSATGSEDWFNDIKGGGSTRGRALVYSPPSSVYLAGDCSGNAVFSAAPVYILTHPYPYRAFVAKYTTSGALNWVQADGSLNPVESSAIANDGAGGVVYGGVFRCTMNEFADAYGQGVFNAIGFRDVFVARVDSIGSWLWSRHLGGPANDELRGLASVTPDLPLLSGEFQSKFNFTCTNAFVQYESTSALSSPNNIPFCGDQEYGNFRSRSSAGGTDVFFGTFITLSRLPYDFYDRNGSSPCVADPMSGCVSINLADNICIDPSAPVCGTQTLSANTKTSANYNLSPGPEFDFSWSTGAVSKTIIANASGTYTVTATTRDGCYSFSDSASVSLLAIPVPPTITDSKGININTSTPIPIFTCAPDSVTIRATNIPQGVTVTWTVGTTTSTGDSVFISAPGQLATLVIVRYTTPNGCTSQTSVLFNVDAPVQLAQIQPYIQCDSVVNICPGDFFNAIVLDSLGGTISNVGSVIWTSNPNMVNAGGPLATKFYPPSAGTYTIRAILLRGANCTQSQLDTITRTVQVNIITASALSASVTGASLSYLCPGDTITFTATASSGTIQWLGQAPGIVTRDVLTPGTYTVFISDTLASGCITDTSIQRYVAYYPTPVISTLSSPALICPGDSAGMFVVGTGTAFSWSGPAGLLSSSNDTAYATIPGFYSCTITNSVGCELPSNSIELIAYSTPTLDVIPSQLFCSGDSVQLSASAPANATVTWLPPLSGNGFYRYVNDGGVFACSISSCGITTIDSTQLYEVLVNAQILPGDTVICNGDSITLSAAPFSGTAIWYPSGIASNTITIDTSGTFTLVVTDPNGCTAESNPVTVNADSITGPVLILASDSICAGDILYIQPLIVGFETPVWTGPNGFSQTGIPDVLIAPATAADSGPYIITLTNGQCSSVPDTVWINVFDSVPGVQVFSSPVCEGQSLYITTQPTVPFTYQWTTPSGLSILNDSILISSCTISDTGTYAVLITNGVCPAQVDSFYLPVPSTGLVTLTAFDTLACEGDTIQVIASGTTGTFYWPNQSLTTGTISIVSGDSVFCTVTDAAGCSYTSDTLVLMFKPAPDLLISGDTSVCLGDTLSINALTNPGSLVVWITPTGDTINAQTIFIAQTQTGDYGTYFSYAESNGCRSTLRNWPVQPDTCALPDFDIVVPNVFTPNGDDTNDLFSIDLPEGEDGTLVVLNRWGNQIFTGPISGGWNGRNMRRIDQSEGVYYFILQPNPGASWKTITGFVHLIR